MFFKLTTGRSLLPSGYMLFLGMILNFTPSVGQVLPDSQLFRDSLYRHISREMNAELSCRFAYGQGSSFVSAHLGDNQHELDKLDSFIREALAYPELFISRIQVTGYSSIEGSYAHNESLARERAEHFHAYLQVRYPELYRYPHSVAWVAEDWQGLSKLVKASSINEREEILEIIRKNPGFDRREELLVYLNGNRPYQILERTMFPQLRRVELQVEYQVTPRAEIDTVVERLVYDEILEDTVSSEPTTSPLRGTPPRAGGETTFGVSQSKIDASQLAARARFAIKTNLLLWAGVQHDFKHTTPMANVALEYFISNQYSIELGAMYGYWRYNSNRKFQGISGYRIEPRCFFPVVRDLLGVYLGPYFRFGDYDMRKTQIVDSEKMSPYGRTGHYWDAGISTGLSINLIGQLGLEVGIRVGYVHTRTIKYTSDSWYNWYDSDKRNNKVRVTDLNVSLIYKFR